MVNPDDLEFARKLMAEILQECEGEKTERDRMRKLLAGAVQDCLSETIGAGRARDKERVSVTILGNVTINMGLGGRQSGDSDCVAGRSARLRGKHGRHDLEG